MKSTGYWVFNVHFETESNIGFVDDESALGTDSMTFEMQRVYIPVTIDTTDSGIVAYYYQGEVPRDVNLRRLRERDGKVYVPTKEVHRTPPPDAERYRDVVDSE